MPTKTTRFGLAALMAAAISTLAGADDATQTIRAGELTFKAPTTWKKERPKSTMRQAQLKVEPVEGVEIAVHFGQVVCLDHRARPWSRIVRRVVVVCRDMNGGSGLEPIT